MPKKTDYKSKIKTASSELKTIKKDLKAEVAAEKKLNKDLAKAGKNVDRLSTKVAKLEAQISTWTSSQTEQAAAAKEAKAA